MLINSISLRNFLSYGESSPKIDLLPLNVIIGPNGSGKSNLLEAIDLLRCCPDDILKPIRDGGGVKDWLWKSSSGRKSSNIAEIDVVIAYPTAQQNLRYKLSFTEVGQRFEITDERIENEQPHGRHLEPYFYYHFAGGKPVLNLKQGGSSRTLRVEDCELDRSILSQRRDPVSYPEITELAHSFSKIRLYREWSFGRYTVPRTPQKADLPNKLLEPDGSNLALILNRLRGEPAFKTRLLDALRELYQGIEDYGIDIEGGTVQIFFQEGNNKIPATRLSDGTLRYLYLLAVLCHPTPPPLVCIEEPELGLHPDVLPVIANLLVEASERTQLIVTTHSEILVDALTEKPEVILVAEKNDQGTSLTRLEPGKLEPWLKDYKLGQLWGRGDIGGNRW